MHARWYTGALPRQDTTIHTNPIPVQYKPTPTHSGPNPIQSTSNHNPIRTQTSSNQHPIRLAQLAFPRLPHDDKLTLRLENTSTMQRYYFVSSSVKETIPILVPPYFRMCGGAAIYIHLEYGIVYVHIRAHAAECSWLSPLQTVYM